MSAHQAGRRQRLHPITAVAEELDVSTKTVRRLIASGALPAHRIGRQWRIAEEDLCTFLAQRRQR